MSTRIHECTCGIKWEVRKVKSPSRDKDSIHCDCGREIESWNGGVIYFAKKVAK